MSFFRSKEVYQPVYPLFALDICASASNALPSLESELINLLPWSRERVWNGEYIFRFTCISHGATLR